MPKSIDERIGRGGDSQAGFTLLEALVALAVTSTVLGSLVMLMGANARTSRELIERTALVQTGRALTADLPLRPALRPGTSTGNSGEAEWRMDVRPFPMQVNGDQRRQRWTPDHIVVQVHSPSGGTIRVETVRLQPAGGR